MKIKPAISVVIPNYNYAHFLGECMQSVIDQTFTDWEMIVVDDGSTDNSREVVEDFIERYPDKRIRYIYKEDGPSGTPAAVNLGIKNMEGKYFAWLSSDDIYMPKKLEVQFDYMEKNPWVAFTHTHFFIINGEGSITGKGGTTYLDYDRIVFDLLKGCNINGNTVLIRKEIFEGLGLFRENDKEYDNEYPEIYRATEYEKWIEIAMNYRIEVIPQCLHKYREHKKNIASYDRNKQMTDIVAKRVIEKSQIEDIFPALKKSPQNQTLYLTSFLELSFLCHLKGWFGLAAKYLMKIEEIKQGLWEEICKSLPQEIGNLSSTEFIKTVLMKVEKYFDISPNIINEFSKFGIQEGVSFLQKGDYAKGKKVLEEWREIEPENIEINYSLGSCYQKEGEFSKAIEKFQQVLSLMADKEEIYHAGAHFHLGEIYQAQGNLKETKQEFGECLRLNPEHKAAKERLFAI